MINNTQIIFTLVTVKRLCYGNTVECLFYVLVLVTCHSLHHRLTFTSLLLAYTQNLIPRAFGLFPVCFIFLHKISGVGVEKIITLLNLVFNGLSTIWRKKTWICYFWHIAPHECFSRMRFLDIINSMSQCHSFTTAHFSFDDKSHKPQDWLSFGNGLRPHSDLKQHLVPNYTLFWSPAWRTTLCPWWKHCVFSERQRSFAAAIVLFSQIKKDNVRLT